MARPVLDLSGKNFNKLIVISLQSGKSKKRKWLCECECGKRTVVFQDSILNGRTKSCGCIRGKNSGGSQNRNIHGMSDHYLYKRYHEMKNRCTRITHRSYKNYGGRGIKMLWKSFDEFLSDMGLPPNKSYSIDRIDNNGNYCKENCRWATRTQQNNNTRQNVWITYSGNTHTLSQWAIKLNIPLTTLRNRFNKGISIGTMLNKKSAK